MTPCGCLCPGRAVAELPAEIEARSALGQSQEVQRGARSSGCTQSQLDKEFGFGMYGKLTCQSYSELYGRAACQMVSMTPCGCLCPGRSVAELPAETVARSAEQSQEVQRDARSSGCTQSQLNKEFGFGMYG